MKKFGFSLVLFSLTVFLFAQAANDYAKLLRGDLSGFVGYWVDGNGHRMYLRADGTTYYTGQWAGNFRRDPSGTYSWNVSNEDEPGFGVTIFPVGVEAFYNAQTDTTKIRLAAGQDAPGDSNGYYYRESEFIATHNVTENLRLRTDKNLDASTIKVLAKGTKVLIPEKILWGEEITVEGKTARWVCIYTDDGLSGWVFSGYLEEIKE
jgi:hypothetical protein